MANEIKYDLSSLPSRNICQGLITALLFTGQTARPIMESLRTFGYYATEAQIKTRYQELLSVASDNIRKLFSTQQPLRVDNDVHVQWMKQYGVFELMDFMARKECADPPAYFKWIRDALWINSLDDVQAITNVLLFNGDNHEDVAAVIRFKYRRQISVEALDLYQRLFFDFVGLGADDVMDCCPNMRESTLILKQISSGTRIQEKPGEECYEGYKRQFIFHDSGYIKWKLGMPQIEPPRAEDFLNRVMADASYRYTEATEMTNFADIKSEDGISAVTGENYNNTVINRKNAVKEQVRLMKQCIDIYVKASNSKPVQRSSSAQDLIDKLTKLQVQFSDASEHMIMASDLPPGVANEINASRVMGGTVDVVPEQH